mmetsp:Transcript_30784/g.78653  ORF Transcript_30784/g.78653 Transcript_30784/m.78653 type:complete len:257 (+) Transcript_30784:262-1032(+)
MDIKHSCGLLALPSAHDRGRRNPQAQAPGACTPASVEEALALRCAALAPHLGGRVLLLEPVVVRELLPRLDVGLGEERNVRLARRVHHRLGVQRGSAAVVGEARPRPDDGRVDDGGVGGTEQVAVRTNRAVPLLAQVRQRRPARLPPVLHDQGVLGQLAHSKQAPAVDARLAKGELERLRVLDRAQPLLPGQGGPHALDGLVRPAGHHRGHCRWVCIHCARAGCAGASAHHEACGACGPALLGSGGCGCSSGWCGP